MNSGLTFVAGVITGVALAYVLGIGEPEYSLCKKGSSTQCVPRACDLKNLRETKIASGLSYNECLNHPKK